jgi:hypothetical protein
MALSDADLAQIETLLTAPAAGAAALADFRRRFPGLTLTRCDASDMGAEAPFREYPRFNLYLVDAADHCWRLTADPARATGIVVAQRKVRA